MKPQPPVTSIGCIRACMRENRYLRPDDTLRPGRKSRKRQGCRLLPRLLTIRGTPEPMPGADRLGRFSAAPGPCPNPPRAGREPPARLRPVGGEAPFALTLPVVV